MAFAPRALVKALVDFVTRRPELAVWAVGLTLAGAVVYYLVTALVIPDASTMPGQARITAHRVQAQGERGTQLGWKFVADSSETSTDGMVTTYHHVHQAVYYLAGKPAYKLNADEVTVDMRSQNYSASGKVHVWSVRPRDLSDLTTENLQWNNPLQTLTCPSEVHVRYKGFDLRSSHLQANLQSGSSTLGSTTIHTTR